MQKVETQKQQDISVKLEFQIKSEYFFSIGMTQILDGGLLTL